MVLLSPTKIVSPTTLTSYYYCHYLTKQRSFRLIPNRGIKGCMQRQTDTYASSAAFLTRSRGRDTYRVENRRRNSGSCDIFAFRLCPQTSSLTIFYTPNLISRNPTILRRTTFGHVSKHLNVY